MVAHSETVPQSPSEFWTVVTDFILSASCAALALRLQHRIASRQHTQSPAKTPASAVAGASGVKAAWWWSRVLWVSALSTLLGAVYVTPAS